MANNAGSVYILLDPPHYEGAVSAEDADVCITTTNAGALLKAQPVGAPSADPAGSGSGAIYLVPAPR